MEAKDIRKLLNDTLLSFGLKKMGNSYYLRGDEILFIANLQKSAYSDGYYINIGYYLLDLVPKDEKLSVYDAHIRTRIYFHKNDKDVDLIKIDGAADISKIIESIKESLKQYTEDLSIRGIKNVLNNEPELLYQTSNEAIKFLRII